LGKLSSSDSTASAADISLAFLERWPYVCRGFGGFRRIRSICNIKYKAKVKTYCRVPESLLDKYIDYKIHNLLYSHQL
jgi:hypothetical protein